jgi:hypothetical protein
MLMTNFPGMSSRNAKPIFLVHAARLFKSSITMEGVRLELSQLPSSSSFLFSRELILDSQMQVDWASGLNK